MLTSRRVVLSVLCLVLSLAFVSETDGQYLHPKLSEKTTTIHHAVILPAKIEIVKESAKGAEMMIAESEQMSKAVLAAVAETLEQKKIKVIDDPFQPANLDE